MIDPETDAQKLGREIREVRKARGVTLATLSETVGCSLAYLSRIERGTARISVALLNAVGTALDGDPAWFFPERGTGGPVEQAHIVRAEARRPLGGLYARAAEELGFEDDLLSSTLSGGCALLLSRFAPGRGQSSDEAEGHVFEGEQHGLVLTGEIALSLGDEKIVLRAGDSFSYPSTIPHRFRNNIDTESTMVRAMTPVRLSW